MGVTCEDQRLVNLLRNLGILGDNATAWESILRNIPKCNRSDRGENHTSFGNNAENYSHSGVHDPSYGKDIYAYVTPLIMLVGLVGNLISLAVFLSKRLRRLSASAYLGALSTSDSLVLLTYVLFEWLNKGLPRWPGNHYLAVVNINGVCHMFLFLSYTFRFVSVYLLTTFTLERYIAVCRPLQRRLVCTRTFARRIITVVFCLGVMLSLYKPLLSGVYTVPTDMKEFNSTGWPTGSNALIGSSLTGKKICTRNPQFKRENFVLDVTFGLVITAVPFIAITICNVLIVQKLLARNTESSRLKIKFRESKLRLEFTMMLLVVSTCFVCLNLPYFIIWCIQFLHRVNPDDPLIVQEISNQLYLTKTIFSLNYAINFFLYCLTGTYYREHIKLLFVRYKYDESLVFRTRPASSSIQSTLLHDVSATETKM